MTSYALQKLLRDVNRKPASREAYFASPHDFSQSYDLAEAERRALLELDITALYRLGVHGLILRPFTLLYKMPEAEYLQRIRQGD